MSVRTPNQDKALMWYAEKYELRPQLSTHPVYYFKDRNGDEVKRYISHILAEWEAMRKEEKRGKSRVR